MIVESLLARRDIFRDVLRTGDTSKLAGLKLLRQKEQLLKTTYDQKQRKFIKRSIYTPPPIVGYVKDKGQKRSKMEGWLWGAPYLTIPQSILDLYGGLLGTKKQGADFATDYMWLTDMQRQYISQLIAAQQQTPQGQEFWTSPTTIEMPDITLPTINIPNPFEKIGEAFGNIKNALIIAAVGLGGLYIVGKLIGGRKK